MSSHIDEKRYSVLVDYLTSCKEGDLRDSRVYPVGATANEKRRIRQQAAMFVLKERLLYYRATDAVNEICLKRASGRDELQQYHVPYFLRLHLFLEQVSSPVLLYTC